MDISLCEENKMQMETKITLQDTLRDIKPQVSNCQCIVNDELTYMQTREKVSGYLCKKYLIVLLNISIIIYSMI